jgi:hypothetical protein
MTTSGPTTIVLIHGRRAATRPSRSPSSSLLTGANANFNPHTPFRVGFKADRSHFIAGEPGWEKVADFALSWATEHARMGTAVHA